jgi:hypothetical protein
MQGVSVPDFYLILSLTGPDGALLHRHREKGHSWVRNYYNAIFSIAAGCPGDGLNTFGAGYMSCKDRGGSIGDHTSETVDTLDASVPSGSYGMCNAGSYDGRGIVIGTGSAAFSIDDIDLDARITHGTGAGQMSFQGQPTPTINYDANKNWVVTHERSFLNNSGASIAVTETGIMTYWNIFARTYEYLLARDVLGTPVTVDDQVLFTVQYEIWKDFSAIDA